MPRYYVDGTALTDDELMEMAKCPTNRQNMSDRLIRLGYVEQQTVWLGSQRVAVADLAWQLTPQGKQALKEARRIGFGRALVNA